MKPKGVAFFSMVVLALALMALIVVTQFFTNKSTQALNIGNRQAVSTFRINHGIQTLVNLSFDLQTKFKSFTSKLDSIRVKQLRDSITMLGYNANILTTATTGESAQLSTSINNIIDSQVNISENILVALQANNLQKKNKWVTNLQNLKPGDKVYNYCLSLEELLKNNLQSTLDKNSDQAKKLSTYNRILALFAIVAILLLTTIIIKRQTQQLKLIDELTLAETAALKSKNAKDEFLANMSHELRTPLNALIGFGNLLNETTLNDTQKEYVDMIRFSGYNLLNIVNDVLDLSKIEAGKLTIANNPFNLYGLFERLEKMFSKSIKEKNLTYNSFIAQDVPENVVGDPDRLQQVFVNLIGNAIKFTSKGNVQVSAAVVWADENNNYYKLVFTIKDTGIGIPKDKVESIFERFEQLEHGALRQHGGTGLGLTIVKNLIEKMGGAISVFSEVNEGSEFNFTCILEKTGELIPKNLPSSAKDIFFKPSKVLVVEDNKANQILLKHVFAKYNIYPILVDNGQDAIDLLQRESFDLIFMDIQMPTMDGYTTINILRHKLQLTIPVVAMTAYVSKQEIQKCRDAGFSSYLPKPIEEDTLVEKLSSYLSASATVDNPNNDGDLYFLKSLVGDDPAIIANILSEMQDQWNRDKNELVIAWNEASTLKIKQLMHRIKSTFAPLGKEHKIYKFVCEESTKLVSGEVDNCSLFIEEVDNVVHSVLKK